MIRIYQRILFFLVLLIVLSLLFSGCFLLREDKSPLKIGVVISENFDNKCEYLRGFDIGVSEYYNSPVDTDVLVYKAVAEDKEKLLSVLDSLIISEKVDLIYGFDKTWMLEEAAFHTRKMNIPIFTPWLEEPLRRTSDYRNVFYCKLSNTVTTYALAEYAVDRKNSWVFIEESVSDILRKGNAFVSRFTQIGGAVMLREDVKSNNLNTYSLKKEYNIMANKPDNYYVAVSKGKLTGIIKDLNDVLPQGLPLYCDTKLEYKEMIDLSMLFQGKIYFAGYLNHSEIDNNSTREFKRVYQQKCGSELVSDTPAIEYDFLKFLMKAHESEGVDLTEKLLSTSYNGITGKFRIDSKGSIVRRDIGIIEMINGRQESFKFLTPEAVN